MAIKPDAKTIKRIKATATRARQRKAAQQRALGKGTDFGAHSAGIMPEATRKALKEVKK